MDVAHRVPEPLIEGLFIPRNVCRLETGRVVKTWRGPAFGRRRRRATGRSYSRLAPSREQALQWRAKNYLPAAVPAATPGDEPSKIVAIILSEFLRTAHDFGRQSMLSLIVSPLANLAAQ
jgi:hypothetical protein